MVDKSIPWHSQAAAAAEEEEEMYWDSEMALQLYFYSSLLAQYSSCQ